MRPATLFRLLVPLLAIPAAGFPAEPLPVTVRPLARLLLHPREEAPAEVKSLNDGLVTAQVAATVQETPAEVGDTVKNGDLLVRLDPWAHRLTQRKAAAELDGVRAQLENARKRLQRVETLHQQKQATGELLEERRTEVLSLSARARGLEALLEESRLQVEKCLVQAPFDGVVVQRLARIGSSVAPGTPLIQLVDTRNLEVTARIPAARVESLTRAASWTLLLEGHAHPVTLRTVTPYTDPATRTREARFTIPGERPVPGSAGRLAWEDPRPHLPAWAVVTRDEQRGVFLVEGERARFHPLPGAVEGHPVPVDPELRGDVVVSGREGVTHDAPVRATPAP